VKIDQLRERVPEILSIPQLIGLDVEARRLPSGPNPLPHFQGALAFHDVCHGSLYDVEGQHIGGPSPWGLDELVLSVRGGIVYADRRKVLPGQAIRY
jgi:hypothetical protein